jgi:hypothetical protein
MQLQGILNKKRGDVLGFKSSIVHSSFNDDSQRFRSRPVPVTPIIHLLKNDKRRLMLYASYAIPAVSQTGSQS